MEDFNLKKYLTENKLLDEQKEKEYTSINAIMADLKDKLPQFKTIDTAPEFVSLMNGIIDLVISQSSDFIESGRFIQAMVQLYNQRKDIQKKAKNDDFDLSSLREPGAKTPTLGKSFQNKPKRARDDTRAKGSIDKGARPKSPAVGGLKTLGGLEEEKN